MLTFVKLGGSLITDKLSENTYRPDVSLRLAHEIRRALDSHPQSLLLGHGSGSFGHVAAKKYGTAQGVHSAEDWRGFAHVATQASELSQRLAQTLWEAQVPAWRISPSASGHSRDAVLESMHLPAIESALEHNLVPLVHGDVCLDFVRGGTIVSTETVFFFLAKQLPVTRIFLFGEVRGVYDHQGSVIPRITPGNFEEVRTAIGGSSGTDVTGGMATKVRDMLALVTQVPGLAIRILDGMQPDLLYEALAGGSPVGTTIAAD